MAAVGVVAVVLVSVPQAHSSMLPSASVGLVGRSAVSICGDVDSDRDDESASSPRDSFDVCLCAEVDR